MMLEIPIHTVSEANQREHWAPKAKRVAHQRAIARLMTQQHASALPRYPLVVTLTRVAPRPLDSDDNLNGSMKAIRDGIADAMGIKDNDPRVSWRYAQEKGPPHWYAVRVDFKGKR